MAFDETFIDAHEIVQMKCLRQPKRTETFLVFINKLESNIEVTYFFKSFHVASTKLTAGVTWAHLLHIYVSSCSANTQNIKLTMLKIDTIIFLNAMQFHIFKCNKCPCQRLPAQS